MSGYEEIQTAAVIRYPYLWSREARKGETEGRKDRPVAVGVRIPRAGGDLALFVPITTKQPEANRFTAEIPAIEKRRAGLDVDLRLWIILDEFYSDIIGRSFYLEPEPPIGRFSKAFFLPLLREFIARRKSFSQVMRSR
ncbi:MULTISPECIES: hypothetical protein [unclassified Rhizobium]|uniref:hypothetical protein n=1 Tax=unclassified Rhizobium TaxID=2613769 RepID=UPI001ADBC47F|nr:MULTISPECIES: hypothetical protein [unclassified Rhizobium]MBO9101758.1 hypothetical protein [Rhizobium sp. L58/93]MBO9171885.1 hypothetical protein [Rhizobium sp. L245/93]MBO9186457.1 hypothetical protein [Rhizobium sp. E27B/91]QXZ87190.1 hypothetical protein J5287_21740 [Rhizobium sp. K1/93]QXZ92777.1 hypothetical protein J5280_19155 [Rhizobium sp. K15/93]